MRIQGQQDGFPAAKLTLQTSETINDLVCSRYSKLSQRVDEFGVDEMIVDVRVQPCKTMLNEPDNPGAGAINLPDAGILRAWAQHNVMHPFPSAQTKHALGSMADMTIAQVSDWFKNYRRRQWIADQLDYLIEDTVGDLPTGGG